MKLWLLRPVDKLSNADDPWTPWHDKCFGFVVRAKTEEMARAYAHEQAGDENRGRFLNRVTSETTEPWINSKYSTCEELVASGDGGVVLQDFNAA